MFIEIPLFPLLTNLVESQTSTLIALALYQNVIAFQFPGIKCLKYQEIYWM